MNLERRREALAKALAVVRADIDRERKGKVRCYYRILKYGIIYTIPVYFDMYRC